MLGPEKRSNGGDFYRKKRFDLILKITDCVTLRLTIAWLRQLCAEGGTGWNGIPNWRAEWSWIRRGAAFESKNAAGYARFAARFLDPFSNGGDTFARYVVGVAQSGSSHALVREVPVQAGRPDQ